MYSEGYVTFSGVECVFIINNEEIRLIPKVRDEIRELNKCFDDQNFTFHFSDNEYNNCLAYIDRVKMNMGHSISLFPTYIVKLFNNEPISSMEITGPAIDEIFHPASYYYLKAVSGVKNNVDLTREIEEADKWTIEVDGCSIDVCLQYGGILRRGIASDMSLHPQLLVTFHPTNDVGFMFKVYKTLARFLKFVQYNSNSGEFKVRLHGCAPDYNSGYFYDCKSIGNDRVFYNQVEYRYIKPYIGKLLQFSADNVGISLDYLPDATYRWNRNDYTPRILSSLFAAFESEYRANIEKYETEPAEDLAKIREKAISNIQECLNEDISDSERKFLVQVQNSVKNIGNQAGQNRKIKNVLQTLNSALLKSAQHMFIREKLGTAAGFSADDVKRIAKEVVALRSQVSHEYSLLAFDDIQTEYVRFLEIIVYCMMLKRAGIDDDGIELIIGIIFNCNSVRIEKMLLNC